MGELSPEKQQAALGSLAAASAMTALKLASGLATGSLGMLGDAAHSGLDLLGAGLTYGSVRLADKPADREHPYGHAKFENVSAFAETFLMVGSSLWISWEAIERIFVHPVTLRPSLVPVGVLLLSIATDVWRSQRLGMVARKTKSDALEADALHFASDIWSSAAVLVGIVLTWMGIRWNVRPLLYGDPVAALVVALFILRMSTQLGRRTVGALVDEIPGELHARVVSELSKVAGVLAVEQARMRRSGARYFADVTLALSRQLTFQHTDQVVEEATAAVKRVLPEADVVVSTIARETPTESIFDRVRAVALRNNVVLHDVCVQRVDAKYRIEQHIEVDEKLPLVEAHHFVRRIEEEICSELPQVDRVLSHIESEPATIEQPVAMARDRAIEHSLRNAAATLPEILDVHEVAVSRMGDRLQLSCHCTMPDRMAMGRVHEVITELEDRFKVECPEVHRVMIHPEPETDNHHH